MVAEVNHHHHCSERAHRGAAYTTWLGGEESLDIQGNSRVADAYQQGGGISTTTPVLKGRSAREAPRPFCGMHRQGQPNLSHTDVLVFMVTTQHAALLQGLCSGHTLHCCNAATFKSAQCPHTHTHTHARPHTSALHRSIAHIALLPTICGFFLDCMSCWAHAPACQLNTLYCMWCVSIPTLPKAPPTNTQHHKCCLKQPTSGCAYMPVAASTPSFSCARHHQLCQHHLRLSSSNTPECVWPTD